LKSVKKDTAGLAGTGISLLGNILTRQSGVAGMALPLVMGFLRTPLVKRTAGNALKGVAGGFLKWKALTLGLRLTKSLLFKKKKDPEKDTSEQ
jgi:hypothetical protein